jgi:hypothetical protein
MQCIQCIIARLAEIVLFTDKFLLEKKNEVMSLTHDFVLHHNTGSYRDHIYQVSQYMLIVRIQARCYCPLERHTVKQSLIKDGNIRLTTNSS